jgi:regulator of sigma E protease
MQIAFFILGFLLFVGLVLVHEWGHYIAARRNGMKVEEFGLGFPPRAWGKKRKDGMILSLNWLPIGGFVKLKGEHDADTAKGSFGAASLGAKTKILVAGVTMNLIVGVLMLTVLAAIGMPKLLNTENVGQEQFTVASDTKVTHRFVQAGYVQPGSPAEQIGLAGRDLITKIISGDQTRDITTIEQLQSATKAFAGREVIVIYKHNGKEVAKKVNLLDEATVAASKDGDEPKGYLGISPNELIIQRSSWSSPIVALGFTKQLIELTLKGIGNALVGLVSLIAGAVTGNDTAKDEGHQKATSQVGGPVAIIAVLWGGGTLGLNFILFIIAILSLTLALINILPIPALDGGRLFVMYLSRLLKGRPFSPEVEERIHGTGMAVLLTLFVLITIVDVGRFF